LEQKAKHVQQKRQKALGINLWKVKLVVCGKFWNMTVEKYYGVEVLPLAESISVFKH